MTIDAIRTSLVEQNALTNRDRERLNSIQENRPFLEAVIGIFEEKARRYLDIGGEQAIQNAYRVFYKQDKLSILPSLRAVLVRRSPAILQSLGLSKVGENADDLTAIEKRVFIAFTARYRLVQMVDNQAMLTLSESAGDQVFPMYLFDSLRRERSLSREIRRVCHGATPEVLAQQLAQTFANQLPELYVITQGIVNYCSITAFGVEMQEAYRPRYFNHMSTPQARTEFTDIVSRCYLAEMSHAQRHLEQMQENAQSIQQQQKFLPALCLLDLQIGVDLTEIENQSRAIEEALAAQRRRGAEYEVELQNAQRDAHARINAWRAAIPERPVTYGVKIGFSM